MQQGQTTPAPEALRTAVNGAADTDPGLTVHIWDRMTLAPLATKTRPPAPMPPALADALALIDLGFLRTENGPAGCRAVPSAGGIYPYEFYVVLDDPAGPAVFYIDALRRQICRNPPHDRAAELLDRAGVELTAGGFLIAVVARQWLSMRKYGDRGYLYTHLDVGHVAANLLGVSAERGPARLHVRFDRAAMTDLLALRDKCREVHCVVSARPGPHSADDLRAWSVNDIGPEQPSWLERMCWQSLQAFVSESDAPVPGAGRPLTKAPGGPVSDPTADTAALPAQWARLSGKRRSSKAFRTATLAARDVAAVLAAVRTPLATDLPDGAEPQVTFVARSVEGLAPGSYPAAEAELLAVSATTATVVAAPAAGAAEVPFITDQDVAQACMRQEHLGPAAAAVLFHTARDSLIAHHPSALRELLFRAGALGQLLYLGAATLGVGVTAVGGFDSRRWLALAGLEDRHEVLYLMLLGVDGAQREKWDRLQTAYAQRGR